MMVLPNLLATKMYFPTTRQNLVHRPRLMEKLREGLQGPLTLISAPAGYGKTTLLCEWHEQVGRNVPVAWLSLDKDDNDPTRFLNYVSAALGTIQTGIAGIAVSQLQSSQPSPTQTFLTGLINEIVDLETPFILVLDDYQLITAQHVHDILSYIFDHQPPQMHLAILTRSDPPLQLARMRARNQLVEIRAADLRFTSSETVAFLSQVMGINLPPEDLNALEQRTEGWVVGLQLAALSIREHEDPTQFITTFGGGYEYIVDYLVEEVLNCQSESLREFLLQTSILDRLTGPLCDAITGRTDGQVMLEKLEKANLFLTPLGGECCWYRYHHLFKDVVSNRLRVFDSGKMLELYRRATSWHAQNGYLAEAIDYALVGEDLEQAALLIEQYAWQLVIGGEFGTLANRLQTLKDLFPGHPWLHIYQAWVLLVGSQIEMAEEHLKNAEQAITAARLMDQAECQNIQGHIATIRALVAVLYRNDPDGSHLANYALECVPTNNMSLRSIALYVSGASTNYQGENDQSITILDEAYRTAINSGNTLIALQALGDLATLKSIKGSLREAIEISQEAIKIASERFQRFHPNIVKAYFAIGNYKYEVNDLESSEDYIRKALEICPILGITDYAYGCMIYLSRISIARGNLAQARDFLQQADQLAARKSMVPTDIALLFATRIQIYLAGGDLEQALRAAQDRRLNLDTPILLPRWLEYCAYARLVITQGMPDAALGFIDRLLDYANTRGMFGWVITALVLKALALRAKGDTTGALDALEGAFRIARPEGFIRTFLDEGEPMVKLLRQARSKGVYVNYTTKLLQEYTKYLPATTIVAQSLIEPLSKRELEVLRLIAEGCSNKEIASRLFITISTVKRHTVTIFQKLAVDNRTQAVMQAREMKLI